MRQLCRGKLLGIVVSLLLILVACATTPYTQRSQLILISQGEEARLGAQAFQEVLSKEKISRDPALQAVVIVGSAIYVAANMLVDILYAYIDPRIRYA